VLSPVTVPVTELVPLLLFCCLSSLRCRAIGLRVPQAPAVASLTEVIGAVSAEVPCLLALQATTTNRGGRRVRGGGAAFWVWLISGAFAPCSVTVNVCVKLFKVIDDASSCEASVNEVGDEESVRVPDDI